MAPDIADTLLIAMPMFLTTVGISSVKKTKLKPYALVMPNFPKKANARNNPCMSGKNKQDYWTDDLLYKALCGVFKRFLVQQVTFKAYRPSGTNCMIKRLIPQRIIEEERAMGLDVYLTSSQHATYATISMAAE